MAINKKQSGPWVKATVIIVTIAFVLSVGFGFITSLQGSKPAGQDQTAGTGTYETVAAKYRSRVSANAATLQADPENYGALVEQGNSYFDWANELAQAARTQQGSQLAADLQALWISAAAHYERALAVQPGDPSVSTDLAIATFYTGDADKAIKIARAVVKKDPAFGQAWFNLGLFYEGVGDNASAIAAFTKFVDLKPKDQDQQLQFANERISALASQPASETTTGQ